MQTKIEIEIQGKSDVIFENDKDLVTVTTLSVPLSYVSHMPPHSIVPKIGFGKCSAGIFDSQTDHLTHRQLYFRNNSADHR